MWLLGFFKDFSPAVCPKLLLVTDLAEVLDPCKVFAVLEGAWRDFRLIESSILVLSSESLDSSSFSDPKDSSLSLLLDLSSSWGLSNIREI